MGTSVSVVWCVGCMDVCCVVWCLRCGMGVMFSLCYVCVWFGVCVGVCM